MIRNYKNGVIGIYNLSHLINVDKEMLRLEEIQEKVRSLTTQEAQEIYGIEIQGVVLKRLQFPAEVTRDVFERMRSERERIAEKHLAEGEGMATHIRAKADAERERTLAEARAKAKKIRGMGDAEAAKYYEVFTKHEELAIFLRKLESLERTLKENAIVIMDYRTPPYDLFLGEGLKRKIE